MIRKLSNNTKGTRDLEKKLDEVYSLYIRMSHADEKGMVQCYTCSKRDHWKKMQCGHYISRRHKSTRWYEKNTKVQCVGCNVFNQGNGPAFAQHLIKDYGPSILEELEIKKNNIFKGGKVEISFLTEEYNTKLNQLKK